MKKESNSDKIKRIYTISKINKRYENIVDKHKRWEIDDTEFIFESDRIYNWSWRKDFISLEQVRDETKKETKK